MFLAVIVKYLVCGILGGIAGESPIIMKLLKISNENY